MPYENWVALQYRNLKTMSWETIHEYPQSASYLAYDKLNAQPDDLKPFYQVIVLDGTKKRLDDLREQYLKLTQRLVWLYEDKALEEEVAAQVQPVLDEICDIQGERRITLHEILTNARERYEEKRKALFIS